MQDLIIEPEVLETKILQKQADNTEVRYQRMNTPVPLMDDRDKVVMTNLQ